MTAAEVHVVSQRLGHTSAVITLQVYARVVPGSCLLAS
jgi:integrase